MARRKRLTPSHPVAGLSLEDTAPSSDPAVPSGKRPLAAAPMAPVARVAQDQAQAAALQELSEEMNRAREGGRMVLELPLDRVAADHLVRDRLNVDAEEMRSLKDSLDSSGQRTPIEVVEVGSGHYGLVSGWRRLTALRALEAEGKGRGTVLALLRRPENAAETYRAMIEENEIRADLSYYERARIVAKAVDAGVFPSESEALRGLFAAASRSRRSKIGSFLPIVAAFDGVLQAPWALPERLGLKLSQAMREDENLAHRLRTGLADIDSPEAERSMIEAILTPVKPVGSAVKRRAGKSSEKSESVVVERDHQGRVTLDGPGVTDEFVERLKAWLGASQP